MLGVDVIKILERLSQKNEFFLLDSCSDDATRGRFSYLGADPVDVIEGKTLDALRKVKSSWPRVGVIGYEGDVRFGLYDKILCVDHQLNKCQWLYFDKAAKRQRFEEFIRESIHDPHELKPTVLKGKVTLKPRMTKAQYIAAVNRALKHIRRGDIYQINVTYGNDMFWPKPINCYQAINIYRHLRANSPTHLSAFLKTPKGYILSSSPERFLSLQGRKALLCPMKGTRPRGANAAMDRKYFKQLEQSAKEKAELLMVTDLARNDLGRVSVVGSVKVVQLRSIETYSQVFQATASVQGTLRADKDIVDLLQASFPSGSVTGCPKLEAMTIIGQIENGPRHAYTGALGYMGIKGRCDFNVMIRSVFIQGHHVSFNVGSGIVADSSPEQEYEETLLKGQAMREAIIKGLT